VRELPAPASTGAAGSASPGNLYVPQLVEPALVGHGTHGQEPADDRDDSSVRPPRSAGAARRHGIPGHPSRPHTQDVALAGESLERRDFLGQDDGMRVGRTRTEVPSRSRDVVAAT